MRVLFVVHRYSPFPGGSEYYVQNMAEELAKRGNSVHVLAHEHQGNLNNVRVTNDYNIITHSWDMIVVHGADCISQNIVLQNLQHVRSPVCYMIIKPSDSLTAYNGMKNADYLAYSTSMDLEHIKKYGFLHKARRMRHGIPDHFYPPSRKEFYMSAGGFYPHKGMPELAKFWNETFPDRQLNLYGYAEGVMPDYPKVKSYLGLGPDTVKRKMAENAFGYILNSYEEGFGLVLLEAMINWVPVYARNIAGAKDMSQYVMTYDTMEELKDKILWFEGLTDEQQTDILKRNFEYVRANHTIVQTIDDLEDIIEEKGKQRG